MLTTLKNLLLVIAGIGLGIVITQLRAPAPEPDAIGAPPPASSPTLPSGASREAPSSSGLTERLAAIERALAEEIAQRTTLADRVEDLVATLEAARDDAPTAAVPRADAPGGGPALFRDAAALRAERERRQAERLVAAGFSPDRAEWLERRVEELRMQALQAQYEATREGRPFDPAAPMAATRTLRNEIGDDEYERYLAALGRSTSVVVREVLASSPAERVGLRPGDQVLSYGGERVFDQRELNALTLEGRPGEPVVLDVRRDGQTIQLVVPRGPIGITAGGFRGR